MRRIRTYSEVEQSHRHFCNAAINQKDARRRERLGHTPTVEKRFVSVAISYLTVEQLTVLSGGKLLSPLKILILFFYGFFSGILPLS